MKKQIYIIFKFFIILFIIIFSYELFYTFKRHHKRLKMYKKAKKRSKKLNKKLIVIGDPYNGIACRIFSRFYKTYGCGDETVDLTGAPKCPNGIKNDIYKYLKSKPSNYGVIFVSCVLEYIDNINDTIKELYRVSGSSKNLFIVAVENNTLSAYLYKDKNDIAKNLIQYENGTVYYKKI
jgi:hypothetical protein